MKKSLFLTILSLSIFAVAFLGEAVISVSFESSDGLWSDSTCPLKGRGFRIVLADFEKYRMMANNPNVTLVRTTRAPFWFVQNNPEWNVPYAPPSGYAKPRF